MTTIEKIKAEIERLYNGEAPKHDQQCNFDDGYFVGIDAIAQFLDTLESEKPMNQDGLEEEIKRYYDDWDGNCRYAQTARHFANWGAEHAKEDLMKEAVEGVLVDNVDGTQEICLHGNRYGEKVHIIIVKEDEK